MKKHFAVIVLCCLSTIGWAQKDKPAKSAPNAGAATLTRADANDFIVYANSIGEFFKSFNSSFIPEAYETYAHNAGIKAGEATKACIREMDETKFSTTMATYKDDVARSTSGQYVALNNTPPKMNKAQAAEVKQLLADYETKYVSLAKFFNNELRPLYQECRVKTNATDALIQFDEKWKALLAIEQSLYSIADNMGDQAEDITLAKHPFKAEIKDMRTMVKLARQASQAANVDSREAFVSQEVIIASYIGEMKNLQAKYKDYNPTGKSPRESGLRLLVFQFFEDVSRYYKAMDAYSKCIKDVKCETYYVNDHKKTLFSSNETISDNYSGFVRANNKD